MVRHILRLCVLITFIAISSAPALADKRVALVIGNAAYQNITVLDNPRNDALLMANTLSGLGFTLVGGGAQLDLDKAGLDAAIQKFGRALTGAEVGLFYYAGHGMQLRGSNFLVPVGANPTREADVDFQMVDVNLVLRQMDGSGTRLNLVVLDACRNNPFGGRGLRSATGGLAQMRAPEGTLISFATQPGNVAMDGEGNSPFTKALAATVRRPGLDIFQTFNEVGLAVKRATGGEQQPWVSTSPIDGDFYFAGPAPAPTAGAPDDAAQAWAATRDTTSIAVLDAFIGQYGNSIYAPFARARRDELKKSQLAATTPTPTPAPTQARAATPRLSRDDVVKMFEPFALAVTQVDKNYVDPRDDRDLYIGAVKAMQRAFPSPQQLSSAAQPEVRSSAKEDGSKTSLDAVYDTALAIMNERTSASDDDKILEVGIKGAMAALDPHSDYLNAATFRDIQTQNRGTFGGVGMEVTMSAGLVKVVSPIDDSPAAKAGVLANDLVASIDDASVQGLTLNQAVARMRGPVGSQVKLRIIRQNADQPIDMTVTREIIRVSAVRWRVESDDVGYIRITRFNEQADSGFKQALAEITRQVAGDRLKGYVIDLRNNPGGLLDQVVLVADEMLDRGEIVSTRGRTAAATQRFAARPGDITNGKRIVVLINGGTASGSEIVAGALQDHKRATIIGTRSYGNGSIQTIIPLGPERGAVRLTTSRYYTPSGSSIQAKGIVPNIQVLQDEPDDVKQKGKPSGEAMLSGHLPGQGVEQVASQSYVPPDPKNDKALSAAVNLLEHGDASPRANR